VADLTTEVETEPDFDPEQKAKANELKFLSGQMNTAPNSVSLDTQKQEVRS